MTTDNNNLALETQQGTLCHMVVLLWDFICISVLKICIIVLISRTFMAAVLYRHVFTFEPN